MKSLLIFLTIFITSIAYANDTCHHVVLAECKTKNDGGGKVKFIGLLNIDGVRFSDNELRCQDSAHASLELRAYLETTNEVHNWCYTKSISTGTSFNGTQDYKRAKKTYRKILANCMKYDSIKKCFSYKDLEP